MVNNYSIAQAYNIPDLITKVNAMISMGWQPQGSVAYNSDLHIYVQAMWTSIR